MMLIGWDGLKLCDLYKERILGNIQIEDNVLSIPEKRSEESSISSSSLLWFLCGKFFIGKHVDHQTTR